MTVSAWIFLTLAIVGAAFGLWQLASRRRTFRRLNALLDRAIAGGFSEDRFDETELSALEGKLARFLRGSAHAQKMIAGEQAAVKALIADISHQTRTPIANLLLYASLLLESDLPPRQREQVRALMTQGEKLSFLIQNLVKASRLETGIVVPAPSQHSVRALLEEVIEQEEPAAQKKGIALRAISLEGAAAFDLRWTSEALGNVVNNAVKYTPAAASFFRLRELAVTMNSVGRKFVCFLNSFFGRILSLWFSTLNSYFSKIFRSVFISKPSGASDCV